MSKYEIKTENIRLILFGSVKRQSRTYLRHPESDQECNYFLVAAPFHIVIIVVSDSDRYHPNSVLYQHRRYNLHVYVYVVGLEFTSKVSLWSKRWKMPRTITQPNAFRVPLICVQGHDSGDYENQLVPVDMLTAIVH